MRLNSRSFPNRARETLSRLSRYEGRTKRKSRHCTLGAARGDPRSTEREANPPFRRERYVSDRPTTREPPPSLYRGASPTDRRRESAPLSRARTGRRFWVPRSRFETRRERQMCSTSRCASICLACVVQARLRRERARAQRGPSLARPKVSQVGRSERSVGRSSRGLFLLVLPNTILSSKALFSKESASASPAFLHPRSAISGA